MTQEDKKLLLGDLCARLTYGVICTDNRHGDSRVFNVDTEDESVYYTDFDEYGLIENCKPYLRPMSSMTDEESKEFALLQTDFYVDGFLYPIAAINMVNWLNSHHFDYCGLIDKGLAIEAPKSMYKKIKKYDNYRSNH